MIIAGEIAVIRYQSQIDIEVQDNRSFCGAGIPIATGAARMAGKWFGRKQRRSERAGLRRDSTLVAHAGHWRTNGRTGTNTAAATQASHSPRRRGCRQRSDRPLTGSIKSVAGPRRQRQIRTRSKGLPGLQCRRQDGEIGGRRLGW